MSDLAFDGHVALVTGAASGIGEATVSRYLDRGARVVALDIEPEALRRAWPRSDDLEPVRADVTSDADVAQAVAQAEERWGRLDIVANVAGIFGASAALDDVRADAIAQVMAVNAIGPTLVMKHALPHLKRGRGSVVNVTSMVADRPSRNSPYYAGSKAALTQMTRCWALELAEHGIRVNAVAPGPTDTPVLERAGLTAQQIAKIRSETAGRVPLGRRCTPDDLARWIVRLSDPDSFVTGQSITVDGGLSLT